MSKINEILFGQKLVREDKQSYNKISVVGVGEVGNSIAYTLLTEGICSELALFDIDENKVKGELLDLRQCLPLTDNCKIDGSSNVNVTKDSNIVILCCGERQKPNESRLELIEKNTKCLKNVVPDLAKNSPNGVFFVVTNPPEVMTYVTWKLSGFPYERVFGHGTNMDSCRLRYFISEKLNVSPKSVNAWVIGEHGDTAVPLWSSMNVGGVNLANLCPKIGTEEDPDKWNELYKNVVTSASKIGECKGYNNWTSALAVSKVCKSILKNENNIYCISTCAKNWHQSSKYNVEENVFISLPCVVGRDGIKAILTEELTQSETNRLKNSVNTLSDAIKSVKL